MAKTQEELNVIKEEVEALNKKLIELTDEELAQVSGGGKLPVDAIGDNLVKTCIQILNKMQLYPTEEFVRKLIAAGGSTLRDWALNKSGGNKMANLIPVF